MKEKSFIFKKRKNVKVLYVVEYFNLQCQRFITVEFPLIIIFILLTFKIKQDRKY